METVWSKEVDNILKGGVFLKKDAGVNNWCFDKAQMLEVLEKLSKLKVAVLGGDVYEVINNNFQLSYDNWYCEPLDNEPSEKFCTRSVAYAKDYVESYTAKNGVCFTIVPDIANR